MTLGGSTARSLSLPEFEELFYTFTSSAFRLETLSAYQAPTEATNLRLFLAGKPHSPDRHAHWCSIVAEALDAGKTMSRVHVMPTQLTPYLKFETEWAYSYSAEAGEEILLLLTDEPQNLFGEWTLQDFWMFDDSYVVRMQYDDEGQLLVPELLSSASAMGAYRHAKEIAVANALPFRQYLAITRNSQQPS